MSFRRFTIVAVFWLSFAGASRQGESAELAFSCKFDGPDKTWQLLNAGTPARISAQECIPGGARENSGIERLVLVGAAGQSALLVCPIPRVAVLDELQIRLWVNASRPDVQLAARVVLPRSIDAQRRGPATAIIRGASYNRLGHWQELRVIEVPKLLAEQVRVMRATPGAAIDAHEAYVDAVVLIVPGNPSGTDLGTDELVVDGVLLSTPAGAAGTAKGLAAAPASANKRTELPKLSGPGVTPDKKSTVRLQGTTLVVDGRPFLPRVIRWNGEPLQFLASCGFNVVQLNEVPTEEQSAEAERIGLWFLCGPEHPEKLARQELGRPGDRVLAWLPQDDALEVDSNYATRWAELVRERDAVFGRPVVFAPRANWAAVSKPADILIASPLRGKPLTAAAFKSWLESCPPRAQPGTPLWVALSTQYDEAFRRQVGALAAGAASSLEVDASTLDTYARIACMQGVRGFVFESASRLSEDDAPSRQRAAMLQLVNRRLQLIEPWLAGGKIVAEVTSSDSRQQGMLLHVDRARLLVPVRNEVGAQAGSGVFPAPTTSKDISFTVPGVPETSQVFYLSPAAMRSLPSQRIAGGTKMAIPGSGDGYLLMAEDPQVIQVLRQRVIREGGKIIQLERDLAVRRARDVAYCGQKLTALGFKAEIAARNAAAVSQQLPQADSQLAAGQMEQAYETLAIVRRQLNEAEDDQRQAVATGAVFESNPLAVSASTLAEYAAFQRSSASLRPGGNYLVGGDFEDLSQMTQLGWQHMARPSQPVQTLAQLSAVEPQQGKYCLELSAAAGSENARRAIESNPVWIVSPPVSVGEKQVVEITGWVRIDRPFEEGQGVRIEDSLGGPALSLVIGQTYGWQPFRIIRAGAESSQLRITFTLAGVGSAKIDGVMVRSLDQPVTRRLPPAGQVEVPTTAKATGSGPGLLAPPTR